AGLLQTRTDGRGIMCSNAYDVRLRLFTQSCTAQPLRTSFVYDERDLLKSAYDSTDGIVTRTYDAYGRVSSDTVGGGWSDYRATQNWDAAGRRTHLDFDSFSYDYAWRADGLLTSVSTPGGAASYTW